MSLSTSFPMFLKFSLLCQLPVAATACSQTCGSCLRAPWVSKLSEAAQGLLSQRVPCSRAAKALWFTPDTIVYSSAL